MSEKKVLLAGLPSSGKTTFVAALWYYVLNADSNLTIDSVKGSEDEYLNEISLLWAKYQPVPRTLLNQTNFQGDSIKMNLLNKETDQKLVLNIPDFSGETYRIQFEDRSWDKRYFELVKEISGIILFIDPNDKKSKCELIFHENNYLRMWGDEVPTDQIAPLKTWDYSDVPSQVKLVDALQFLVFHKPQIKDIKVSVVISAWDKIQKIYSPDYSPVTWTEKHMPLLYQYLITNEETFKSRFYGISAQGGDYGDIEDKLRLQAFDPLERIIVKEDADLSKDIIRPILWATHD